MNVWKVLGWSAVAGFGALVFLRLVSHHIWVTETLLDRLDHREGEARRKRNAPPDDEPVTGVFKTKLA